MPRQHNAGGEGQPSASPRSSSSRRRLLRDLFAADGRFACALAIRPAMRQLGLDTRTGLHIGEVEMRDEEVSGLAVHTAARVMAEGGASEIPISNARREALLGQVRFAVHPPAELKRRPIRKPTAAAPRPMARNFRPLRRQSPMSVTAV